MKIHPIRK